MLQWAKGKSIFYFIGLFIFITGFIINARFGFVQLADQVHALSFPFIIVGFIIMLLSNYKKRRDGSGR